MLTFPAMYSSFDAVSERSQDRFYNLRRGELACLVLAGVSAAFPGRWAGAFSVLLFLVALFLRVSTAAGEAEKRWYQARAAAESIKSMSWQYAVGGESFRLDMADADNLFRSRLYKLVSELDAVDLGPPNDSSGVITDEMRGWRTKPVMERHDFYIENRVRDQKGWYSREAEKNRKKASCWRAIIVSLEGVAVVLGLARALQVFEVDMLGILASAAAACAAWFQMRNYVSLATAYALTAHEIDILDGSFVGVNNEEAWSQFVHDSEAAFSREHTMWLARRQGPLPLA